MGYREPTSRDVGNGIVFTGTVIFLLRGSKSVLQGRGGFSRCTHKKHIKIVTLCIKLTLSERKQDFWDVVKRVTSNFIQVTFITCMPFPIFNKIKKAGLLISTY